MLSSTNLCKVGALVYPIMLTQQCGEISEAKAAELLDMRIEDYREKKAEAVQAVCAAIKLLPSPLHLLLEGTRDRRG
jgi:hypothetical protein